MKCGRQVSAPTGACVDGGASGQPSGTSCHLPSKGGFDGRQVAAPTGACVDGGASGQPSGTSCHLERGAIATGNCVLESLRYPSKEGLEAEDEAKVEALEALREASEHQFELWLRRIKRKFGGEVKFVSVTSDLDGDTGEVVRVHHHVVLAAEGISWDLLRSEWKLGGMDIRQLRHNADYTPIALYLMRQVRRRPDAKKYRVSRGMVQPEITEREILGNVQMRVPVGAKLLEASEFNLESAGQYMRYIPKKKAPKGRGGGDDGI